MASSYLIPNSTQVPDLILDRWMAELSGAEFKVVLYVVRRTYGFRRAADTISLEQMASGIVTHDGRRLDGGTGLSRETVAKTVAALEGKGILLRQRHTDPRGGNLPSTFALNLDSNFGVEIAPPKGGVRKSDPIPDSAHEGGDETGGGGAENLTPSSSEGVSESDSPLVRKSDPLGCENLTHNRQGWDRQSSDTQVDRQAAADSRAPAPVTAALPAAALDAEHQGEESDSTLHLVTSIVRSARTAMSIVRESGEEVCRRQALWWPHRLAAKGNGDKGALFRVACREDWPAPEQHGATARERAMEGERARRYITAPRRDGPEPAQPEPDQAPDDRTRLEAFWSALAPAERDTLTEVIWQRALSDAPPPLRVRIEKAAKSQDDPSQMVRAALGRARQAVLRAAAARHAGAA